MAKRKSKSTSPALKRIEQRMAQAENYDEWYELALEHDQESGADLWREKDETGLYDYANITSRLSRLKRLRRKGDDQSLLFVLNEGIHGNMAGMGKTALYNRAKAGTKKLIEKYIEEICDSLQQLAPRRVKKVPLVDRVEFFQRASHCYGRSALMLSGGGTLGFFHFGVMKALIEQKLCPVVISGASAGSFVAAVVGTHTDEEYLALFEDDELARMLTVNNANIDFGIGKMSSVDMAKIQAELARVIPDMTFQEAYEKTGRSINITISPAEPRQTSRLLNHIASPNVTIRSAVLASSAVPGVFPSVQLQARNEEGKIRPYLPSRRWIDGSFSQDLPAKRLARMYGVNHFIVSQVMPGLGREPEHNPGITNIMTDAWVTATKRMLRGFVTLMKGSRMVGPRTATGLEAFNAFLDQQFVGDINILPHYGLNQISKILAMLDEDEVRELIRSGERATWPKIPAISTTTRIGRTLDGILHEFEIDEAHWLRSAPQLEVVG